MCEMRVWIETELKDESARGMGPNFGLKKGLVNIFTGAIMREAERGEYTELCADGQTIPINWPYKAIRDKIEASGHMLKP